MPRNFRGIFYVDMGYYTAYFVSVFHDKAFIFVAKHIVS